MRVHKEKRGCLLPYVTGLSLGIVFLVFLVIPGNGYTASVSGESRTILRMGRTVDDRNLYPLYEYLNLGVENDLSAGSVSGNFGGWGRVDVRDKSTDRRTDASLQYGFVDYRGNKNNLSLSAGRQFVVEGVAAERIDGIYFHSDFIGGFGAAAFVGSPVVTEPDFKGGDIVYGGRITQGIAKYYTIGISALRTDNESDKIREETGVDVWIHPLKQLDIVGRSSYNNITSEWMEHAYTITVNPFEMLKVTADMSMVNYRDYFYQVTTSALSLKSGILNPNEKLLTLGGGAELLLLDNKIRLAADYRNYDYDVAGQAKYYGGKATFFPSESLTMGLAFHRMEGETEKLTFNEYRVFASKKIGKANLTLDFFDAKYDHPINGIDNTYSAAAAIGYEISERLNVAADIDYGKSVDFDRELRGMIKLTYLFDKKFGK